MRNWRKKLLGTFVAVVVGGVASGLAPLRASEMEEDAFFEAELKVSLIGSTRFERHVESYRGAEKPGTIIVDTRKKKLYHVLSASKAMVYGVGVGREGFEWSGRSFVSAKAEWPSWTPPAEMHARQPGLPKFMPGGPENPMGARALYIGDTLYRIHGTNDARTVGRALSSGCIRMLNEDVIHLFENVKVGAQVVVY